MKRVNVSSVVKEPSAKKLLYVLRTALTGIHLLEAESLRAWRLSVRRARLR